MPYNKSQVKKSKNSGSGGARYSVKRQGGGKKGNNKRGGNPETLLHQLMPYILSLVALFILICYFVSDSTGVVGVLSRNAMFGLFSYAAWAVPFLLVNIAVYWKRDVASGSLGYKFGFSFATLTFISVLVHAFASDKGDYVRETFNVVILFENGCEKVGGGMIGGFFGNILLRGFGFAGTLIFSIALVLLFAVFLFGMTPHTLAVYLTEAFRELRAWLDERISESGAKKSAAEARTVNKTTAITVKPEKKIKPRRVVNDHLANNDYVEDEDDNFFDAAESVEKDAAANGEPVIDPAVFDEIMENEARKKARMSTSEEDEPPFDVSDSKSGDFSREKVKPLHKTGMQEFSEMEDGEIDLAKIFAEDDAGEVTVPDMPADGDIVTSAELDLMVEKSRLLASENPISPGEPDEESEESPETYAAVSKGSVKAEQMKIDYAFPPISLLKYDTSSGNTDMSGEIQHTATKLVETLRSFNVKTKIINVSRGPTITRYELQPEVGTKVRSIVNLVDDIALHLATSGVRIEAPIPGKEAVGIEVPNRSTSTVYIRELIEEEAFSGAKSKVTTALGMDVAGSPVYLDVAKMPHMLIAGTTGSGKSVCINSLIISILYKARPDEVKFILIDPKKVELNIYNGIPHLLVPVVSDPKKAAGSLHWAVTEMERRYELIEGAGVRNIKGYNDSIANDPDAEKLPQIVIIIDELADLMMTAKDDVEEAICRIAQKARAAGMHLIIGTQRPSVDVITGLIKANVPSRIAFTTVSQIDSRTIIDIAGAEKLIGRGDMLFSPVGCIKPMRVQGAFVSDDEVEAVTSFVKNNYGVKSYDQSVIDTIEREAQLCGNKKATVLGDGDEEANDGDPMLKPAIELAVESGKISTSLIQRRLQLGYGRAAKLIDAMEQMGIVSPPQGQKPRDVLISKQEYMEMELRRGD